MTESCEKEVEAGVRDAGQKVDMESYRTKKRKGVKSKGRFLKKWGRPLTGLERVDASFIRGRGDLKGLSRKTKEKKDCAIMISLSRVA